MEQGNYPASLLGRYKGCNYLMLKKLYVSRLHVSNQV